MKRTATALALVIGALIVAGSSAAVRPKVTRAQAVKRLAAMLGAKPQRVQLVWADVATTRVVLEWTGYAPHARIRVVGGPVGKPVSGYYRGPAEAWLAAEGGPPEGVASVRPTQDHRILPLRSTSIPVALSQALGHDGADIRLTPLRVHPPISRVRAIAHLRRWGDRRRRLQAIWLVSFRKGAGGSVRLAWMAVTLHARVPILGCTLGKTCRHSYTSPLASFLDARSGKFIQALTINGWKRPQLLPG